MQALDVTGMTIAEAGAAIRSREVSPAELTEAYLQRIERLNPTINAYVTVTAERAREDARRATDEIAARRYRGPLHGIPIGLKDLFDTAGIRTTAGSKIFAERVPANDCTAAAKLAEAGAVLLGKLNTHEFAAGYTTNNPHFGPTRNPWMQDRIPGGSSGGSGAAIVAGLAAGTLGTDTGGSIRVPASFCGCVGLKPTYGRVSKAGVFPLSFLFDHVGPITRTVEDAAIVLQAIAGYDPADASAVRTPVDDYASALGTGVRGLKVGVPRGHFFDLLDDDVRAAVDGAIATLRSLGAEVREVELPGAGEVITPWLAVLLAEAGEIHRENFSSRPQDFGPDVAYQLSLPLPGAYEIAAALRACYGFAETVRSTLEEVDLLVCPATPLTAPRIGEDATVKVAGQDLPHVFGIGRCMIPFNVARVPALVLPCGFSSEGLPIGLQLVGRPFDEATVLRAGHAYEQATEWHRRRAIVG